MDLQEIYDRTATERLYTPDHPDLIPQQMEYLDLLAQFNSLAPSKLKEKEDLLKQMFRHIGTDCYIETPFRANWGGKNVSFGNRVYANFNLVLVDDGTIEVGDSVMIGPNVTICTAEHPISPTLRKKQAQYNLPVKICNNVWIGANCVILPGVTIGENSVIGAGSIVTKDIPANVVAFGSPCKTVRPITEEDEKYYHKNRLIDIE